MDDCGQGALEYILLVGAAIMLAVIAIMVAKGTIVDVANSTAANASTVRQHITNVT